MFEWTRSSTSAMVDTKLEMQRPIGGMKFLAASWAPVLLIFTLSSLQASAQPGFLSIDCGASAPYIDNRGISWVTDTSYISTGSNENVVVGPSFPDTGKELTTLRSFPDISRSSFCYVLPTKVGQVYMVRPKFYHAGYPAVTFDVGLDTFGKATFSFTTAAFYSYQEYTIRAQYDNLQLCLIRSLPGNDPFISSLELRPLNSSMYAIVQDGFALSLEYRYNYGATAGSILRYPDDPYDRQWLGVTSDTLTTILSTGVTDSGLAADKPPAAVMNTALTSAATATSPKGQYLHQSFTPAEGSLGTYYVTAYFAELQPLSAGESRIFDVFLDGAIWVPSLNVFSAANSSLYVPIEIKQNFTGIPGGTLNVTLSQTAASTLGPLCSASELFMVSSRAPPRTPASDVLAIESVKTALGLTSWTGDPCLLVPYNWVNCTTSSPPSITSVILSDSNLTGTIPSSLGDLTNLTSLWLDKNSLTGGIPDLSKLTNLQQLHLETNQLTGPIPEWLGSMTSLKELYLQNNQLSGNVPKNLMNNSALTLQITPGNTGLCLNQTCSTSTSSNIGTLVGIVVGVLVAVGVAVGVLVYCLCFAKKSAQSGKPTASFESDQEETIRNHIGTQFKLAQVLAATNNHERILGKGGFGPVYYGKLPGGKEVAVKVSAKGSAQGSREFLNEVELLTRVHHKNLVSLVGYCQEGDNLVLLYEYMPNGTVQEHLYGKDSDTARRKHLDWATRLDIALNAAQGLEYLHTGCSPSIFHRDVKSNNILLTHKWVAKVADFGLSKSTNTIDKVTHVSTMVKGTIGYLDPEYFNTNQLTDKSDVFSFGIVLLELMCGRPPFIPSLPEDQRRIDQWVRLHLQTGNLERIVDPTLGANYNMESMWKLADLAMSSVEPKSMHRPTMSVICQELHNALQMERMSVPTHPRTPPPVRHNKAQSFEVHSSISTSGSQTETLSFLNAR